MGAIKSETVFLDTIRDVLPEDRIVTIAGEHYLLISADELGDIVYKLAVKLLNSCLKCNDPRTKNSQFPA